MSLLARPLLLAHAAGLAPQTPAPGASSGGPPPSPLAQDTDQRLWPPLPLAAPRPPPPAPPPASIEKSSRQTNAAVCCATEARRLCTPLTPPTCNRAQLAGRSFTRATPSWVADAARQPHWVAAAGCRGGTRAWCAAVAAAIRVMKAWEGEGPPASLLLKIVVTDQAVHLQQRAHQAVSNTERNDQEPCSCLQLGLRDRCCLRLSHLPTPSWLHSQLIGAFLTVATKQMGVGHAGPPSSVLRDLMRCEPGQVACAVCHHCCDICSPERQRAWSAEGVARTRGLLSPSAWAVTFSVPCPMALSATSAQA
jgi:hypothetical protein